jgi:hypothetical protein
MTERAEKEPAVVGSDLTVVRSGELKLSLKVPA